MNQLKALSGFICVLLLVGCSGTVVVNPSKK